MSRIFQARTGHTDANPQLCGLTQTRINVDDDCFYLVCNGQSARPDWQIAVVREEEYTYRGKTRKKKIRETPDGIVFHSVFTGQWESYTKANGTNGRRRVYEWQREDPVTGARYPVVVWSNMVLVASAESLGYRLPGARTKAHQGDRTVGWEQQIAAEAEPAMVTLAKAALTPEEAGEVAPAEEATA